MNIDREIMKMILTGLLRVADANPGRSNENIILKYMDVMSDKGLFNVDSGYRVIEETLKNAEGRE